MTELLSEKSFVDTIPEGISKDDFIPLASKQFTPKDKEIFGNEYEEQMLNILLYFSVFASYPSTFDSIAIASTVDLIGSSNINKTFDPQNYPEHAKIVDQRVSHIITRASELGVIEEEDKGQFYIEQKTIDKLKPILEQF